MVRSAASLLLITICATSILSVNGFKQKEKRGTEYDILVQRGGNLGAGSPPVTGEKFTAFILPHSHDDPGWVRTSDQYFDIFVSKMYSSVVESLKQNPSRRFQLVEIIYFKQWWDTVATDEQRADARAEIDDGRLEFVIGAWCMPDEAIVDYTDLIETITVGNEWILDTFGPEVLPRHGFQVDPFGASSAFAAITAKSGFESHLVARLNWWDKGWFQRNQNLEMVWRPNDAMYEADGTEVFFHVMDEYQYSSPGISQQAQLENLCALPNQTDCPGDWEGDNSKSPEAWEEAEIENGGFPRYPFVNDSNVEFYGDVLVNNTIQRAAWFATNNVLICFGSDFTFFAASKMYESMDRIIAYVNAHNGEGERYDGVTLQYGHLSEYYEAVHVDFEGEAWPVRGEEDFLPYNTLNCGGLEGLPPDKPCSSSSGPLYDDAPSWPQTWSGFYASHVHLKIESRRSAELLRVSETMHALALATAAARRRRSNPAVEPAPPPRRFEDTPISDLRDAVALLPHHDGVSGTMGPGCGNDPRFEGQVPETCAFLPMGTPANAGAVAQDYSDRLEKGRVSEAAAVAADATDLLQPQSMPQRPPSVAALSLERGAFDAALSSGRSAEVVVYNPLGWRIKRWVKVALPTGILDVVVALARNTSAPVAFDVLPSGELDCAPEFRAECVAATPEPADRTKVAGQFDVNTGAGGATLYVLVELSPLGFETITVTPVTEPAHDQDVLHSSSQDGSSFALQALAKTGTGSISNGIVDLAFSDGVLASITTQLDSESGEPKAAPIPVKQELREYEQFDDFVNQTRGGGWSLQYTAQRAGSYLMHPKYDSPGEVDAAYERPWLEVVRGVHGHVTEVRQRYSPVATQLFRLYGTNGANGWGDAELQGAVEYQQGVGPLSLNREIVALFSTEFNAQTAANEAVFYSDNNGLQYQRRVFTSERTFPDGTSQTITTVPTEKVALNYFPLTREAFVRDETDPALEATRRQLHVLAAQSGGVASRLNGQLEVMTHRRMAQDDNLGACAVFNDTEGGFADLPVDDTYGTGCDSFDRFGTCRPDSCPSFAIPMNVSTRIFPAFWLLAGEAEAVANAAPRLSQLLNNPPQLLFSSPTGSEKAATTLSPSLAPFGEGNQLPCGVHLLTLRSRDSVGTSVVLRLQNIASESVAVDFREAGLCAVLGDDALVSERTINTVWPVDVVGERRRWKGAPPAPEAKQTDRTLPCSDLLVTLAKGDIRTWLVGGDVLAAE